MIARFNIRRRLYFIALYDFNMIISFHWDVLCVWSLCTIAHWWIINFLNSPKRRPVYLSNTIIAFHWRFFTWLIELLNLSPISRRLDVLLRGSITLSLIKSTIRLAITIWEVQRVDDPSIVLGLLSPMYEGLLQFNDIQTSSRFMYPLLLDSLSRTLHFKALIDNLISVSLEIIFLHLCGKVYLIHYLLKSIGLLKSNLWSSITHDCCTTFRSLGVRLRPLVPPIIVSRLYSRVGFISGKIPKLLWMLWWKIRIISTSLEGFIMFIWGGIVCCGPHTSTCTRSDWGEPPKRSFWWKLHSFFGCILEVWHWRSKDLTLREIWVYNS